VAERTYETASSAVPDADKSRWYPRASPETPAILFDRCNDCGLHGTARRRGSLLWGTPYRTWQNDAKN
ncbi:MAG: hypothetical protein WAM84_01505, partial [Candidatus Cybelea sp.]